MGTAASRLRRPCLNLRLLLYNAISSRAEVAAGSVAASSLSRLAAGPMERGLFGAVAYGAVVHELHVVGRLGRLDVVHGFGRRNGGKLSVVKLL